MDGEAISNGFAQNPTLITTDVSNPPPAKKKRNLPGNPDPEAEVIALSPKTLMATNRFLCEICGKGFQRDQNLQLHRRGHNLPWKLKQRSSKEPKKRVYVCPEKTCVHNHPSRALGDLTGIKKHFCRKHGEKKWKCEKCSKRYAVQSDWKAHSKTCGTREYRCDCGTLFSRRDSFITHRAFCDALAEETARVSAISNMNMMSTNLNYQFIMAGSTPLGPGNISQHLVLKPISSNGHHHHEAAHQVISHQTSTTRTGLPLWMGQGPQGHELSKIAAKSNNYNPLGSVMSSSSSTLLFGDPDLVSCSDNYQLNWVNYGNKIASSSNEDQLTSSSTTSLPLSINVNIKEATVNGNLPSLYNNQLHQNSHQTLLPSANMSATALLQKAAQIGATSTDSSFLGSLGLKCNNTNAQVQVQDQNMFSGFYATSNTPIILSTSQGNIIDVEKSESDDQLLQMYSAKTKQLVQSHDQESAGGQTRDFLGVGIQTICQPSSINGWF